MKFTLTQEFDAGADAVFDALRDPTLYRHHDGIHKISPPEVVDHVADETTTTLVCRYRFVGEISGAARRVLDPSNLAWTQTTVFEHADRSATLTMDPDHYGGRFRCQGSFRVVDTPTGSQRVATLDINVKMPVVARAVEAAIASGLGEYFEEEIPVIEAFIAANR